MGKTWKDVIIRQREALTRILLEPLEQITSDCIPLWQQRESLENLFLISLSRIPYCDGLFALNTDGLQISASVSSKGVIDGTFGCDRSLSPYMRDLVPAWGFLLSEPYIGQLEQPTITALQLVRSYKTVLGFVAANFDLRNLPVTSEFYTDSENWCHLQSDDFTKSQIGQSSIARSQMDVTLHTSLMTLENLITERGVFQCEIHFSGNMATIWQLNDPYKYQLLDNKMLTNREALNNYQIQQYPENAKIPRSVVPDIIEHIIELRQDKDPVSLRCASINLFNGKIGLGFYCDSIYFTHYDDFLDKHSDI